MNPREFARRRRQLMRMIGRGGVALLAAAPERVRNRDVTFPYRQDSDFLYLTDFPEPEAIAVLIPGRNHGEFILFCRDRDPERERWDGERVGTDGAVRDYGADDAFPIADVDDILPGLLEQCERVYHTMGTHPEFDARVIGWVNALRQRAGAHAPHEFVALDPMLHDMRLYKSRAECSAMRRAARIGVAAHRRAMQATRPGMYEYEIEAEYLHEFRRHDAVPSYQPIVAGGHNACVLHYTRNNARLQEGDLLLIDAGCECEGYASDITRTFPVSGEFDARQRDLYEVVLEAQRAAIAKVGPGHHWNEPHEAAVRAITRGLKRLGLIDGNVQRLVRDEAYRPFFMHRTGHWLGLDVHDVGDYRVGDQWRLQEPGMAMTVEPGIYIAADSGAPKSWRGLGVRIEDDVLVTRDGHQVLSAALPVDAEDIEALMARAGR